MDKFIDKVTGKVVLKINDDGTEEVDRKHFDDIKDGVLVITRTSTEENHYHEFDPTNLASGTSEVEGHSHAIAGKLVQPAENGHTHALPMGA